MNDIKRTRLTRRHIIWLLTHSRKLDRRHRRSPRKRDNFLTGVKGEGGVGTKSYDDEKAWSSINHSILSDSCYASRKSSCSGDRRPNVQNKLCSPCKGLLTCSTGLYTFSHLFIQLQLRVNHLIGTWTEMYSGKDRRPNSWTKSRQKS